MHALQHHAGAAVIVSDDAAVAKGLPSTLVRLQSHHDADPYPSWETRAARLRALKALLVREADAIADAIHTDFGHRPRQETRLLEVFPCLDGIRHALGHGRGWMRARKVPVARWFQPASAFVLPQPLGVVGIVAPWNYPLFLSIAPLTGALVAGNRAMVKVSESTPSFGALLADLLPGALGPEVVAVVNGDADVAAAFSALPFAHLVFTGSTTVGRCVMATAAERLVPVTLELGGKCPAIVTARTFADRRRFANAVRRIVAGKALNAGQTCIAPDYVLLPEAAIEPFVALARETLLKLYPAGAASDDLTAIVGDRQRERLSALQDDAVGRGARAVPLMADPFDDRRKRPLTALTGCPPDARCLQEEIFGPLLPLVACETVDAAIAYVNARPHPLALYLFDGSRDDRRRVLEHTRAGGVCIDETLLHIAQVELPFGGTGASGMGHYRGRYGFDSLSKLKPVFVQSRLNAAALVSPPYRALFERLVALMTRP